MTISTWRHVMPIVAVGLSLCGALMVRRVDSHLGLSATYRSDMPWQRQSFSVIDREISTAALGSRFAVFGQNPFSVNWRGFLAVRHEGRYRFFTRSDDGSVLVVDGQVVVENGGEHGPRTRSGDIFLNAGFHPIELTYFQAAGGSEIELGWRSDRLAMEPIPRTALLHDTQLSWPAYAFLTLIRPWVLLAPFLWVGLIEILLIRRFSGALVRFLGAPTRRELAPLAIVLTGASVLILLGLSWGLPNPFGSWAPDEVGPSSVLEGMARRFGGGWYDKYPLLHYYLLAAVYAPFWLLASIAKAEFDVYPVLAWVNRLVCAQMAIATLVVVYSLGREMRGAFAGLVAVAQTAVLPTFLYYGKVSNLDVPYLFWSICALFFYVRAITRDSRGDYWRFALAATLAVCTKDQAYGLFVLPAAHLLIVRARQLRQEGRPVWRLAADPPLGLAVLTAVVAFVVGDNLVFNWPGFVSHVRLITGPASEGYQVFPATAAGQVQLLLSSLTQIRWSFGWPLACLVAIAVAATAVDRTVRHRLWVLLPALSYYLFFLSLILYSYDRFFLPICLALAVVVGCWAEDLRDRITSRPGRIGIAATAIAIAIYSCAYGASVDRMMLYDGRYVVEDWLAAHAPVDVRIGTAGFSEYLPRISGFQLTLLDYQGLTTSPPEFVVVNSEHMARYPPETDVARVYAHLTGGSRYRLALSYKTTFRLAPFASQPEIANNKEDWLTNLDKINPEIRVFERIDVARQ